MRIARLQTDAGPRTGVVVGATVRPLPADVSVLDLLSAARGDEVTLRVQGIGELRNRVVEGFERIELPRARASA